MIETMPSQAAPRPRHAEIRDASRELPLYYPRQVVLPADLNLEQEYFRAALRRHNRYLHGWGVVWGARVCRVRAWVVDPTITDRMLIDPWHVAITPGYLLDWCGNEIVIECHELVDVRGDGRSGSSSDPSVEPNDPWCVDDHTLPAEGDRFVAVRYRRVQTRPVRVPPVGCGCESTQCQYSRLRDHFETGVLTSCPNEVETTSHDPCGCGRGQPIDTVTTGVDEGVEFELSESVLGTNPPLLAPPFEPRGGDPDGWVSLARVEVGPSGIVAVHACDCRKIVPSLAQVVGRCTIASVIDRGPVDDGETGGGEGPGEAGGRGEGEADTPPAPRGAQRGRRRRNR